MISRDNLPPTAYRPSPDQSTIYHAAWVLPIAGPPIRNGWVEIERERIIAVGGPNQPSRAATANIDLGSVAILPALANAHTHLELSWLRGAIQPAASFTAWVQDMMRRRMRAPAHHTPETEGRAIDAAIEELQAFGTGLVGDVANSLASADPLRRSGLTTVLFHELIKFNPKDQQDVDRLMARAGEAIAGISRRDGFRIFLAPHAPYSVAPSLFRAIKASLSSDVQARTTVHVGESAEEVQLLQTGDGPWRILLEALNAWDPTWAVPGCGPVEYLDRVGFWDRRVLAVHGVQLGSAELDQLAASGAILVTCPRSNLFTGAGPPPIAAFYASGVPVAVGTDSLTSAPDLSLFSELATLRQLAPAIPASRLLESATRVGAQALGYADDYGTIEPGKRAALIAVRVPPERTDVEEYLVSGIDSRLIRWLDAHSLQPRA